MERPGKRLIVDLLAAQDELAAGLAPFGSTIDLWLEEPSDQQWFPYRPGGLAAWTPKNGAWSDHSAVLGISSFEGDPRFYFRWSDDSDPWLAILDPYLDTNTTLFTLDGLIYTRENAERLFGELRRRICEINATGLLTTFDEVSRTVDAYRKRFVNAGK